MFYSILLLALLLIQPGCP